MHKGIAMLALAAVSGVAQGTWNDLKFGTSVAEVRESLSKQGLTLKSTQRARLSEWQVTPGWDLEVPGIKVAFHFDPYLTFSESDKLERISLGLKADQHNAEGIDTYVLTDLAATKIHEQLVGRYGAPVSQTGICDRVSLSELVGGPGKLSCAVVWKAQAQTVKLDWTYFERSIKNAKLFFIITYTSSSGGGL
jgi:hypothetical protein